MSVPRRGRFVAAGALAALVAGAAVVPTAAGAAPARAIAHYRVTKSGTVSGGAVRHPGRFGVHVNGSAGQSIQFVRSRSGAGKAALVADVDKLNRTGSSLPLEHDFRLVGGTSVHHTVWINLKAGVYYAADPNTAHLTAAKIQRIRVSGSERTSHGPVDGTVTAVGSRSWSAKPASIPHTGYLRFVNHAKQSHFIDLERLKPGKTRADIGKALQGKESPGKVFYSGDKNSFDTGVLSPGAHMVTSYTLPRGKYALLCFWPDRKTGMPHALMGMYRVITLT